MARPVATADGRYEPQETPPVWRAWGTAAQLGLILAPRLILLPLLVVTAAGGTKALESRVVLISIVLCSLLILVTTVGYRRLKTDNLYISSVDPTSIPFCILALKGGGPGALAALVAVTGLFQVLVGMRLSRLRRLITPAVSSTLFVLSIMSLLPVLVSAGTADQSEADNLGLAVCVVAALGVMVWMNSRGRGTLKLWAAPVGLVLGVVAAVPFGLYDFDAVRRAPWFGLPEGGLAVFEWLGGEDPFGVTFFTLLPSFVILGLAVLMRTHGASIVTQLVSWRRVHSIDYREVERANVRLGLGSVASGLAGSLPVSISPVGIGFIARTGCASRRVGAMMALPFLLVAAMPKAWALATAMPRALVMVYLGFVLAPLLIRILKLQRRELAERRNIVLMGLPLLLGLIVEIGFVDFPDNAFWRSVSSHGLPAGSILLVVLALVFNAMEHRRRIEINLDGAAIRPVKEFVEELADEQSWDAATRTRLGAVAEEALLVLMQHTADAGEDVSKRLQVAVTTRGSTVELEFASGPTDAENLDDRLALLSGPESDMTEVEIERDVSLRLLRHYATSVNHRQYHAAEIITAVVEVERDRRS